MDTEGGVRQARLRAGVVFDVAIVATAATMLAFDSATLLARGGFTWWLLLVVPVVAVLARFPLVLQHRNGGVEIGFDPAVLVFLLVTTDRFTAVVVWSIATVAVQMTVRKSLEIRVFNTGVCIVSGWVAAVVAHLVGPPDTQTLRGILSVGFGCAAYFVADLVVSAASIALTTGERLRENLWEPTLPLALGAFLGVDTLGWLAGLVLRVAPVGLPLLAGPLVGLLLAVRAFGTVAAERARLARLYAAAADVVAAQTVSAVGQAGLDHAARLLSARNAYLSSTPPPPGQIGVPLPAGDAGRWLVVESWVANPPWTDDDASALRALAAVVSASLERARLAEANAHLARHDPLTGLPNRRLLAERMAQVIEQRRRDGRQLAVVMCDLDRFKAVNDTFGHETGDAVLVALARRLEQTVRPGDTVARLGGDEFAVLLESVTGEQDALAVCQRLREALAEPVPLEGSEHVVGASVGVVVRDGGDEAASMLAEADAVMYAAKLTGTGLALAGRDSIDPAATG